MASKKDDNEATDRLEHPTISILGAGITGIVLAHSFHHRQIPFELFEQSAALSEHGAGLSFNPAALRALKRASPSVWDAYKAVAARSHPMREDYYWGYVAPNLRPQGQADIGVPSNTARDEGGTNSNQAHVFELLNNGVRTTGRSEEGHGAVRRSAFLAELVARLPPNTIQFNKRVTSIIDEPQFNQLHLTFTDGTSTLSDLTLGADGIKSATRRYILDAPTHPSNDPRFSGFVAYRSLTRREDAAKIMGSELAQSAHFRAGNGVGYVSYPITGEEYNNLGIFRVQREEWAHWPSISAKSSRGDLLEGIGEENKAFRDLVGLLDEELDVWAIYDFAENPLPTFARKRAAVLGDAAHASTPNLGAGAGVSIEDAVVVAELVDAVIKGHTEPLVLHASLEAAMKAFSDTRMERCQWLVRKSRELGVLNCGNVMTGHEAEWDIDEFERQTKEGYFTVWRGQIDEMVGEAKRAWSKNLASHAGSEKGDRSELVKL